MTSVTAEAVWNKINEDPEFLQESESIREVARPFIEALPIMLAEQLDSPVNVMNVNKAKLTFLRYCVDNGYVAAATAATYGNALDFLVDGVLLETFESTLKRAIETLEFINEMMPRLESGGLSNDEIMLSQKANLNQETRKEYLEGALTIGRLLAIQPMVIVRNTE